MARSNIKSRPLDSLSQWSVADAIELYNIERWSSGYFSANAQGNLIVTPGGAGVIDVKELIDELLTRGISLPLLLRFSDVLKSRIETLNNAFAHAMQECGYKGNYRGVYPIKVNQSRTVVEEIVEFGKPFHYGLEAGSKPELMAVLALHNDPEALIVCNGYKDEEYIQMALLGSKLGRTIVLVAEKPSEIDHIHHVAKKTGIKPSIGIRARLSSRGAGRWEMSGGDQAKFGLSASEMMDSIAKLREWGELDCLNLLHFHLGSQISAIRSIKDALREAGRLYVELNQLGCTSLRYLDVGGGLGVNYDGSQTNFTSSINYTVQEYANDVVWHTQQICDAANVPHPTLVTESGRAVAAHHAVLIVNVLEVSETAKFTLPPSLDDNAPAVAKNLFDIYEAVSPRNVLESFHDAIGFKDEVLQLFNLGHLSLEMRVLCEQIFWSLCRKILNLSRDLPEIPEELQRLEHTLSDTYFLNFSLFQSLPDSWAVEQLFPVVPIHRLHEEPTRRGTIADITCDSDGRIDQFISQREVKRVLELHPLKAGEGYYLGMFLVGAYQEILGDLHNLFGDTNAVHVSASPDGRYQIEEVFTGDTVADVLQVVAYSPKELIKKLRKHIECAIREGRISLADARTLIENYRMGLDGYTYLEGDEP